MRRAPTATSRDARRRESCRDDRAHRAPAQHQPPSNLRPPRAPARRVPNRQTRTATTPTSPQRRSRRASDFPVVDFPTRGLRGPRLCVDRFPSTRARRSDWSPHASRGSDSGRAKFAAARGGTPRRVSRQGSSHTASGVRTSDDRNSLRRSSASSGKSDPDRRGARLILPAGTFKRCESNSVEYATPLPRLARGSTKTILIARRVR